MDWTKLHQTSNLGENYKNIVINKNSLKSFENQKMTVCFDSRYSSLDWFLSFLSLSLSGANFLSMSTCATLLMKVWRALLLITETFIRWLYRFPSLGREGRTQEQHSEDKLRFIVMVGLTEAASYDDKLCLPVTIPVHLQNSLLHRSSTQQGNNINCW